MVSFANPVEEIDDVVVPKADASVAGWGSNEVLLIGSVDINVALTGIGILRIKTFEPEDSREHEILIPSLFRNLSGRNTASEDHSCGGALADFLRYPEASRGSSETPFLESESEPRCRDGPGGRDDFSLDHFQDLTGHVDEEVALRVGLVVGGLCHGIAVLDACREGPAKAIFTDHHE